jgi:hypothetical protein
MGEDVDMEEQGTDWHDALQEAYENGYADAKKALAKAIHPFVKIVRESNGRIPTEKLSFYNWDCLCRAFEKLGMEE